MKQVRIADTTLCVKERNFSFKEKLEIARQLEKLNVDIIEIPEIENAKTDILFVRTVSSFVKKSTISVVASNREQSIENAIAALSSSEKARIKIELPVSPVGMEYLSHKKAPQMLEWIKKAVKIVKDKNIEAEFCAVDATRAEPEFLSEAISAAVEAGADCVTVCDSAAKLFPDDFAAFVSEICKKTSACVGVSCEDKNGLALASATLSLKAGANCVKTAVGGSVVDLETFVSMISDCGDNYGLCSKVNRTELHRIIGQINWISSNAENEKRIVSAVNEGENSIHLEKADSREDVIAEVLKLGYDLSQEDQNKVYEEFVRVAEKKKVGTKELDAIVASVALQVPATYKLKSYVINNGNVISASAQITLEKDGEQMQGVCIGDGPIDAAFLAIDRIIGHHYELDDFQIQSVTEGKEAMGSALVKLRSNGKLYSGNGISTDIIGASIRAYLNAVNKIVYEEA